jgi:hypothetical protein
MTLPALKDGVSSFRKEIIVLSGLNPAEYSIAEDAP